MTARHSDHRAIDGVLAEAPLADAIGPVCELLHKVQLLAKVCVLRRVPDCDQADMLEMLFAPPHGFGETAQMRTAADNAEYKAKAATPPAVRRTDAGNVLPEGNTRAASDYRTQVRKWGSANGLTTHPRGPVNPALVDRYVAATGCRYEVA